jgi:transposase
MSKTVRKYTKEFKQEAINLTLKSPSISHTARELGVPMATLHTWVQQLSKVTDKLTNSNAMQKHSDIAKLLEENRRLNKELAIIKEEKEILKKAATYFAQHQK